MSSDRINIVSKAQSELYKQSMQLTCFRLRLAHLSGWAELTEVQAKFMEDIIKDIETAEKALSEVKNDLFDVWY